MNDGSRRGAARTVFAAFVGVVVPLSLLCAQPPAAPVPLVTITLKDRHGHCTPLRTGFTHTGGGNIDVQQPKDDTVLIVMSGVAVAGPHPCKASSAAMNFDLNQCLEIGFANDKVKKGKLTIEAQIVGLLRGDKHGGGAGVANGTVALSSGGHGLVAVAIEGHSVAGDENLSINDRKGPVSVPVLAGEFTLTQTFSINATHVRGIVGKGASAEFAPDPALDPLWISYFEPFHGAAKKDFGFKVLIRVEPD